jgi:iron complex outermembrane recepter protein
MLYYIIIITKTDWTLPMAFLLAALMATSAANAPNPDAIPEVIIVTASPLGDATDALSQGVSVVSRLDAANASITGGIGEAISGVPGVRATFYGPNASRPIIRGLGEDRIRLMLNGLAGIDASTISPDHAPAIDGLDADAIEVLKGPAALRYGSNAIGGVVNVVDGRLPLALPEKAIEGEVFLGASTAESAKSGAIRLSAKTGNYVFRVDGLARSSDDYDIPGFAQTAAQRAITGDETEGTAINTRGEIWAFGVSGARITERTNLALSVRETKSNYGIPGEEAFIELEQTRIDARAIIKDLGFIDSLTLSATSGDYTHSEIEFSGETGTVFTNKGYEGRVEARLKPIGNFDGLYGIQFGSNDFSALGEEAFILPVTIEQVGLFGFQRYKADIWGGELGARYEERSYSGLAGERDFDLTSGSASIFATPLDGLRVSLSVARTQRAPTEVELFADGPHAATQAFEIGDPNLKTETSTSVEGGVSWKRAGWTAKLDIWRAQFDGFVAFAPTGEIEDDLPVYEVTQADALLTGYEIQIAGPIWRNDAWSINGDAALDYVRGRYDDGGGNIARMPPMLVTLGLEAGSSRFTTRGEVQILSDQTKLAAFETATDGATTYNLRFGWKPLVDNDDLELTLEGRNLSDEEVREHTSFLKEQLPKPGRSVRLSVRARF